MGRYRGRWDIIADILLVAENRAKKTQIMYQANLSYKALQKYLAHIVGSSLVDFDNETNCFVLTDKGAHYLKVYKRYIEANKSAESHIKEVVSSKKLLRQLFTQRIDKRL